MVIKESEFDDSLSYALLRGDMGGIWDTGKDERMMDGTMDPELIQRAKERTIRAQLNSADGDTCEVHDQFYRDHKLLLVLFRALAVMPILRSAPGRITFNWKSIASIYAYCFYAVSSVIVLIVGYERIKFLQQTKKFDEYIYGILFVIFLVPHFWIPFVGWGVAKHVAVYKTMWGAFQVRYYRVTGTNLQFPHLKILIVIFSVGCLVCAIVFLLSLSLLLEGFTLWHTSAYYHIITMLNMNSSLWYINCRGIRVASSSLSDRFSKDVAIECTAAMISQYRFLWLNLSELLQSLGNAYARTYSTYCLFMFVNITIAVYGALSEVIDNGFGFSFKEIGLIVDTIYCSILLFIFCDCSHNATLQVAQGVQDTLLGINLLKVDQPTQKEIDLFVRAIEMNPAIVSLKGYAEVNRELLTASIATITIYLVVLLQFKLSLISQQMPSDLLANVKQLQKRN
ncbi:gustatory and odorant receptor 22-like [Toxorhynchites rutilus septentrionalis]|uniref:gustatory and odorant receptor 22-like n=1 Tax=Toxorhynchites rutilus septentrionalis TaxID=329112 RepID=UPI002479474A|nr:gustatory and odorant receptor 22-like [Toxorhynchites rutilus septentrionalis]